ncbi:MAG: hypothetical protein FWH01_11760 [Oscillospiraceae bacterium]|nr:hypothetical protein [Oscillospiraceae bacterium]
MYTLQSDRLRVDVSEPGVAPNTTTRFDRAGFVEEVVLDGIHRFCASEPRNLSHTSSGGRGICNEYIVTTAEEAAIGDYFMKPGIGLLLKETDSPYRFMNPYKVDPFTIDVSHVANVIQFVTQPKLCGGYALKQVKRMEVVGNRLDMCVKLENTGEKEFVAREYCHNFITVNCMTLGPNYNLEFPSGKDRGDAQLEGELMAAGKGFTFSGPLQRARMFTMEADEFSTAPGKPFEWIFKNVAEGAQVHVYEQIDLCRVVLWSVNHMMSTESFHAIKLAPGESDEWKRSWVFDEIK